MFLDNKVAVVTGAARGIGATISKHIAEQGAHVILIDRLEQELESTVNLLKNKQLTVEHYVLDIKNHNEIKKFFEWVTNDYRRLDILVNNAAISPKKSKKRRITDDIPLTEWEDVLQINLTGTFLFTKYSLPFMIKQKWGRIINISSVAGRTYSRIAGSHYAATKSGMIGFSRTVASEYGKYGITVNNIAPGRIETDMAKTVSAHINDSFIDQVPMKRSGTLDEVADVATFLCKESSGYITGATIDINGGLFMS